MYLNFTCTNNVNIMSNYIPYIYFTKSNLFVEVFAFYIYTSMYKEFCRLITDSK